MTEDDTISMKNSYMMHDGVPVTTCHARNWSLDKSRLQINGYVPTRKWKVIGPIDEITPHGHGLSGMHLFDFFIWTFPETLLSSVVTYRNAEFNRRDLGLTKSNPLAFWHSCLNDSLQVQCPYIPMESEGN